MKVSALIVAAGAVVANAARTYNITAATLPGEFDKYHCLTTAQWIQRIPPCVQGPQKIANAKDGCAYDDFVCHCINYQHFSDIIEPLVFPWEGGDCDLDSLNAVRPVITDMCNYMNATLYTAYAGCLVTLNLAWPLSQLRTFNTIAGEQTIVTH